MSLSPTTGYNYKLVLEDGTILKGCHFGADQTSSGEVVFTTAMVGYPESLTDPSYLDQILVLTYPLVGNYGVPDDTSLDQDGLSRYFESSRIHARGLVVAEYIATDSHWQSSKSLGLWLKDQNIPGITGIDTRRLTLILREHGVMKGWMGPISQMSPWEGAGVGLIENSNSNSNSNSSVISRVSRRQIDYYGRGERHTDMMMSDKESSRKTILVVDLGIKQHMIRCLVKLDMIVKVVPWNYDFTTRNGGLVVDEGMDGGVSVGKEGDAVEWDGLFLSNGPGDPTHPECQLVVKRLREVLSWQRPRPIFAICLGHQLLALAAGGKTMKMKFGHRSMNQPCLDTRTGRCYITSQNHGYCVDAKSLPKEWRELFINVNDSTNEGLIHQKYPYFSVQFHPEARGGPPDTGFLFKMFREQIQEPQYQRVVVRKVHHSIGLPVYRRVLLLGSGGLSIGQAGEFDYSGSQAIKALKEEGLEVVLINPNIATVQTTQQPGWADRVEYAPLDAKSVEKVICETHPDGILGTFGGQSALSVVVELEHLGVLEREGVRVMGTPISTIEATEDRGIFAERMKEINQPVAQSEAVESVEDAVRVANKIGYPVMVRAAYTLGGQGSGFANCQSEVEALVKQCLVVTHQVLVERSMRGWKEIEYEVVRDRYDNCITVCNMENFDPLGVHTGDSIVVAPSQTLSNDDYYRLRQASIRIIRHLGVVGECNVQYAVDPHSDRYCVIEVNARLSRSSALASKATGYPLAYVAAKLALGEDLSALKNKVTETTTACYEPSLDYIVVKIPRWDLAKFPEVDRSIGSAMKSVGEVMAIGRTFTETIQKAARMVTENEWGLFRDVWKKDNTDPSPSESRLWSLVRWLYQRQKTPEECHRETRIDRWFISGLHDIVEHYRTLQQQGQLVDDYNLVANKNQRLFGELLYHSKKLGFNDWMIGRGLGMSENHVRQYRQKLGVTPRVHKIDTTGGEFPARTNYMYLSYQGGWDSEGRTEGGTEEGGKEREEEKRGTTEGVEEEKRGTTTEDGGVMVLGCGAYRIGSSVEFDWCAVRAVRTLQECGRQSIVVNYNPETVSTDYDISDRLYFEELTLERILDIYQLESASGVIVSVGGQIPNTLAKPLSENGVRVLGTSPDDIDRAEDRQKFSGLLDKIGIDQPQWAQLTDLESAKGFANRVGYPVLIRPSYVLSGAAMKVVYNDTQLGDYLGDWGNSGRSVVVSQFLKAKEIEMDGVADRGELINYAVSEHVENAGVHSGDATLVLPAQKLYLETVKKIKQATREIVSALNISGPFNIQFLSQDNDIKVIECNLRASRSFPFASKTIDVDFIGIATRIMLGCSYEPAVVKIYEMDRVGVKCPVFSFPRLPGADPVLGVEMASTGEVACFAENLQEAYLQALTASGFPIHGLLEERKDVLISIGNDADRFSVLDSIKALGREGRTGRIYATPGTHRFLVYHDCPVNLVEWDKISDLTLGLVINIPKHIGGEEGRRGEGEEEEGQGERRGEGEEEGGQGEERRGEGERQRGKRGVVRESSRGKWLRRYCIDSKIGLVTNVKLAKLLIRAVLEENISTR